MRSLRDKVVLVTGGSSGIGQAAANRLAENGAKLALAARDPVKLNAAVQAIQTRGGQAISISTDVTKRDDCRQAVERTIAHFGQLDILLCSAGLSMRTDFENTDLAAAEAVMSVNFLGTMYMTHYALPHIKATHGSMVALSSLTGIRGVPSYSVYGASKFAIEGLYASLRLELRRSGVHVGVVAPGFVATPLRDRVLGPGGKPWDNPPEPPFRVWTVDKCVDRIMTLILRRRAHVNLPWFMGPLFWLDCIVMGFIGDRIMLRRFPPL